jgi:hypothetical protein
LKIAELKDELGFVKKTDVACFVILIIALVLATQRIKNLEGELQDATNDGDMHRKAHLKLLEEKNGKAGTKSSDKGPRTAQSQRRSDRKSD